MSNELDSFEVFPWNENLETHIPLIDEQHKTLVSLLNKLTDTLVHGDETELTRVFDDLAAYADYHFATEETIWRQYFGDDPWLDSHQEAHVSFLPRVLEIKEQQGAKPLDEIIENIVKFLIRWLAFHIIDGDKRMALVLHKIEKGIPLKEAKHLSAEEMSGSARLLIDTVLNMYDGLSSRTLDLMRERLERMKIEQQLLEANQKLEELAVTDQLTGLHNRRYFEEVFDIELRRAQRELHYLTYIMFDIDHFKKLNDRYGHVQGDKALKRVGEKLRELCRRPGDFVFRLGGEEFGILIADHPPKSELAFAERIRRAIQDLNIENIDSDTAEQMTISMGVVTKKPDSHDSMDSYLKIADSRLYQAKEQGRNCVVSSD